MRFLLKYRFKKFKDIDFIATNKVTHIINTVVKKVPNLYEKYGIQYLSVNWSEKEQNVSILRNRFSIKKTTHST